MTYLYAIQNKSGTVLCYQVAAREADAVGFAKMYGHKTARRAVLIREN